jgi:hypothetical protein
MILYYFYFELTHKEILYSEEKTFTLDELKLE